MHRKTTTGKIVEALPGRYNKIDEPNADEKKAVGSWVQDEPEEKHKNLVNLLHCMKLAMWKGSAGILSGLTDDLNDIANVNQNQKNITAVCRRLRDQSNKDEAWEKEVLLLAQIFINNITPTKDASSKYSNNYYCSVGKNFINQIANRKPMSLNKLAKKINKKPNSWGNEQNKNLKKLTDNIEKIFPGYHEKLKHELLNYDPNDKQKNVLEALIPGHLCTLHLSKQALVN